jgi:hypothetical protein
VGSDDYRPTEFVHRAKSLGAGYHVLVEGTLPPGRNRRGDIELYETGRFFTITGNHIDETPKIIHERTDALTKLYETHDAADNDSETEEAVSTNEDEPTVEAYPATDSTIASRTTLSEERVVERARNATNGTNGEVITGIDPTPRNRTTNSSFSEPRWLSSVSRSRSVRRPVKSHRTVRFRRATCEPATALSCFSASTVTATISGSQSRVD